MQKDYLTSKNIPFTEKLVDQDSVAQAEMSAKSGGFLGAPFTVITKDDGTEITVVGFDKGRLNSSLGITE